MSRLTHWEGEPVAVWSHLWGVPELEVHDTVGSTNDRVRERAGSGAAPWTVVLAEEQTRGRGRSGDGWHSPPGSGLWISTLVPVGTSSAPCLPLLVGLAAARALEEAAAGGEVGIKWPNDLMVGDRKVGGILCEGTGSSVVVGVGINVRTPPGGFPGSLRGVATSVEDEAGRRVSRATLATGLLNGLRTVMEKRGEEGVEELRPGEVEEVRRRDVLAGRRLVTGAGEGTGKGVDARGALLLERPDGTVARVVAGSVRLA